MVQLQKDIMEIVQEWAKVKSYPIPFSIISECLPEVKVRTLRASLKTLCHKRYLRKSDAMGRSAYVLRRKLNGYEI